MRNRKIAVFILFISWVCLGGGGAQASDTMLMFVGEDLDVLSIASRREEAAWSAPAIADVITKEEIENKNAQTIAQVLEDRAGFHISRTERSSALYLRGIPESALILFDTVPLGSGVVKSESRIDHETSLASVKRIEIIRGTGSVLWGPDAFAGVVNVVPLSGKDLQGGQAGLTVSSDGGPQEAYFNYGHLSNNWSGFVSVSAKQAGGDGPDANVVRFWNDGGSPEPVETRYGIDSPDDSHFLNFYSSMTYEDWLTLSIRLADSSNAYTVSDWDHTYQWKEKMDISSHVVKVEAHKELAPNSGFRFTGYLSGISQDHIIIDRTFDREESSLFGEMIYDQSFFLSKGMLTLGGSMRRDEYDRIPEWRRFWPSFLTDLNEDYLPEIAEADLSNDLYSMFGQYRHEFNQVEIWVGTRYDDHEIYEDKVSYNAGFSWNVYPFIFKGIYGTAYRTPFIRQLQEGQGDKLEKIETLNGQLSWKNQDSRAALTLFRNEIQNHVIENRYEGAGLATPNSQIIYGMELELSHQICDKIKMSASLTLLNNSGANEIYRYNDLSVTENEDDGEGKNPIEVEYPYNTGPDAMGSLNAVWDLTQNLTLIPTLRYFSAHPIYYPVENEIRNCPEAWIMDLNLRVKNYFPFDLNLFVKNLFDNEYMSPGLYSTIEHSGVIMGLGIQYSW